MFDNENEETESTEETKNQYGHLLVGRPERQKVIRDDDIMDLQIALETTKDVKSFLELF